MSIPLYEPFRARAGVEYVVAIDNVHYYAKSYDFLDHDVSRGEITALGGGTLHGPAGAMPSDTSCGTTTYHVDGAWGWARREEGGARSVTMARVLRWCWWCCSGVQARARRDPVRRVAG